MSKTSLKRPAKDMLEIHHASPWYSVGKILPTSNRSKEDVFESYKPKRQCVDYKISETWTKMQRGDLKVNVKQTSAVYKEIPPELCKPTLPKKIKLFSGGPPQWKFVEELWEERIKMNEAEAKSNRIVELKRKRDERENKKSTVHNIVQELVGPEWFMELSPKQLSAINKLQHAVYWDIRKETTSSCEEILAILGLVLRPNKHHIRKALAHSCGSPVEFLLVLYQLLDPKRTSYSLNDRLLLSSVVHLSIVSTLRELHVRIPSPPKTPVKPKTPKVRTKKKKYTSPYLEPQTFEPRPPKFSGVYKNKHKQYPENPYFSYITNFENEKLHNEFSWHYSLLRKNVDLFNRMKEYCDAQKFYETIPGVRKNLLRLIAPTIKQSCPNMFNPRKKRPINPKLVAPHLRNVACDEIQCFCPKDQGQSKIRPSCCEQAAQRFLGSICWCDDCLESIRRKNLIRIHGGIQKNTCVCDETIPIIQGTLDMSRCSCYKEYRDRVVVCAAKQRMLQMEKKSIVGGMTITKFGPIYNVLGTQGEKICICQQMLLYKSQVKKMQETLFNSEAKQVVGGVVITKDGPVFNLNSVVARRPCKCILSYYRQLEILKIQNNLRQRPVSFVNNGLINSKIGPVFHLFCTYTKTEPGELRLVCSCEIEKPPCFQSCMDYFEYNSRSSIDGSSTEDSETEESSDQCECQVEQTKAEQTNSIGPSMEKQEDSSPERETQDICQKSEMTSSSLLSVSKPSDGAQPKSCTCKDELERFLNSKCPCEKCNRIIRQEYATYIMGGTVSTPSGNQVNVVQGVHQPQCGCMRDHLENVQKIDEYKNRIQARYKLRKQPNKYLLSGVKNTPEGPIYMISGVRPSVDCECAKALREEEEKEAFEKQRAKLSNVGRMKYEISGVKAMPDENVYILARALDVPPCACERLLSKFEEGHKTCFEQLEKYEKLTAEELKAFEEEMGGDNCGDSTARNVALNFAQGYENFPSNAFLMKEMKAVQTLVRKEETEWLEKQGSSLETDREVVYGPTETNEYSEENETFENQQETNDETTQQIVEMKPSPGSGEIEEEEEEEEEDEKQSCCSSDENSSTIESVSSSCISCHVDPPPGVTPITIPGENVSSEMFVSKRFAIFRQFPKCRKTLLKIVKHILEGMAEDGFPLAKLPQAYKLPIFKLWVDLRIGVYWTIEDKCSSCVVSRYFWKHTDLCYDAPKPSKCPFTLKKSRQMTWRDAKLVKSVAEKKNNDFYRKLKQITVDTAREFFSTTFAYEFPTKTWRDCACAYLPTKEEDIFPYRIVRPHEARIIPDNKKLNCYC